MSITLLACNDGSNLSMIELISEIPTDLVTVRTKSPEFFCTKFGGFKTGDFILRRP